MYRSVLNENKILWSWNSRFGNGVLGQHYSGANPSKRPWVKHNPDSFHF